MKAYAKNIRISPKKIAVVASIIRWQDAKKALDLLNFMPKKWANLLYKVVKSAVSNAVQNDGQKMEDLKLATVMINKWIVYKRWHAISRGRYHKQLKRTSNITVELEVK